MVLICRCFFLVPLMVLISIVFWLLKVPRHVPRSDHISGSLWKSLRQVGNNMDILFFSQSPRVALRGFGEIGCQRLIPEEHTAQHVRRIMEPFTEKQPTANHKGEQTAVNPKQKQYSTIYRRNWPQWRAKQCQTIKDWHDTTQQSPLDRNRQQ